jgi:purine nucleosidase
MAGMKKRALLRRRKCVAGLVFAVVVLLARPMCVKAQDAVVARQKVIIDTDIGDDIDDAFALALALKSPALEIVQANSDYGDTALRARLLKRFLDAAGRGDIPIGIGISTPSATNFTQRRYAERVPAEDVPKRDAVESTLELIRKYPGEITLIALGPDVNVGMMIERDPETFHKLKRVVMMGGSVSKGYLSDSWPYSIELPGPEPEWNMAQDIWGAQKLFASGVPIYMMPLDATQLKLEEVKRRILFRHDSPITNQLLILYVQWGQLTPTLYDPVAVAYSIDPRFCPTTPMRIRVDDKGYTRVEQGEPNAQVCLKSDPQKFFGFYMGTLLAP